MAGSVRLIASLSLLALIYGCNNNDFDSAAQDTNITTVSLRPLSPFQYELTNEEYGKIRIEYFFTEREDWKNKQFRDEIRQHVNFTYSQIADHDKYGLLSIYVYAHSEELNEKFKSAKNIIGTEFGEDVISYTRWHQAKQDIFYFIESGNVVFDMLSGTAESDPWDFD